MLRHVPHSTGSVSRIQDRCTQRDAANAWQARLLWHRRPSTFRAEALREDTVLWFNQPKVSFLRLGPDVSARGISLHLNLPPVEVAKVASASLRSSPSKQWDVPSSGATVRRRSFSSRVGLRPRPARLYIGATSVARRVRSGLVRARPYADTTDRQRQAQARYV